MTGINKETISRLLALKKFYQNFGKATSLC